MLLAMIAGGATAWMHYYLLLPLIWLAMSFNQLRPSERFVFSACVCMMVTNFFDLPVLVIAICSLPTVAVLACYFSLPVGLLRRSISQF